jgi:hypothetical protein
MFFLVSQSSNHAGSISREPSLLGPIYDELTNCGQEIGCEEDHDYIMMLNDQPTSHITNITLLKPYGKAQSQDHLSSQASYPHVYDGNFDYANEEINYDYVKPIYDTFVFNDDANEWSTQIDEDHHDFNDACEESLLEILMNSIKILNCIKFLLILCFNQKRLKNLTPSSMSLLGAIFISMIVTIVGTFLCFLIHVMNLLCIMTTMFLIERSIEMILICLMNSWIIPLRYKP